MKEIRVGWLFGLHEDDDGNPTNGGTWFPDTPENRRDLRIVVEAGWEAAGAATHWIEQREA